MDMPVSPSCAQTRAHDAPLASWVAVASVGVGAFALVTTEFLPVGLLPQIAADIGICEGRAGLMVTTPGILAAIAAPLTIGLAGRFDRKHVLVFLLGLLVLSNAIVAMATSFQALMFGRVLLGIGVGGFWTIGRSLGPRLRPGAEGGRATSLIYSGVSLGMAAGVPAGHSSEICWDGVYHSAWLLESPFSWLLRSCCSCPIKPQQSSGLAQIPAVLRNRKTQVGLLAAVLIFIGQFAAYTYVTSFLKQVSDINAAALSVLLLGYGIAGFIGNLFAGWAVGEHLNLTLTGTAALISLSAFGLAATGG